MILSSQLLFSEDQDLSQVAGTYNSTNIVDFGAGGTVNGAAAAISRDVGKGGKIPVLIQLTETVTSGGAATLVFQIETDSAAGFSTDNKVVAQSRAYALAELVAGKQFEVDCVPNDMLRYMRINYVVGGATTTAGTATAGITAAVQTA